jgi:WD40 repeat protein
MEWSAEAAQVPRHRHRRGFLRDVSLHPDGKRYAVTHKSGERALAICDLETGAVLAESSTSEFGRLHDITYLQGGERLLGAGMTSIVLLDAKKLDVLREVPIAQVKSLALSPGGDRVVAGTTDGRLVELSASSVTPIGEWQNDFDRVTEVAFHPDGRRLAVAGKGATSVALLDPAGGRSVPLQRGGSELALAVAVSPDGRWVAAGSDVRLRAWSTRTGELVLDEAHEGVRAVLFTDDGKRLLSGRHPRIEVFDTARWSSVVTLFGAIRTIEDMALARDGTLITCDQRGDVLIWRADGSK